MSNFTVEQISKVEKNLDPAKSNEWCANKVTLTNGNVLFVPRDDNNLDTQVINAWVNAGNTIAEPE